jgi:hypothetical protein
MAKTSSWPQWVLLATLLGVLAFLVPASLRSWNEKKQAAELASWACAPDIPRVCANVGSGQGRINQCLREHLYEVSAPCRDALEETSPVDPWRASCGDEIDRHCAGLARGGGRLRDCLMRNRASLGERCVSYIQAQDRSRMWLNACRDDASNLCPDVRLGQGQMDACLRARHSDLSISCRIFYQSNPTNTNR